MPSAAIVGGGIGGLAAAIALMRAGWTVDVYEQAPELTEIGAGIGVFPNATRVLQSLGLTAAVEARGFRQDGVRTFRWRDGQVISIADLRGSEDTFGAPYFTMHRAHLVNALLAALPRRCVHLDHRLTHLEQDPGAVTLTFANGRIHQADVAIGADGIRSTTAKALGLATRPRWSGYAAYRTVVPAERVQGVALDAFGGVWLGPEKHFAHYWLDRGRLLNVICYVRSSRNEEESWTMPGSVATARALFDGWHPTVCAILDAADEMLLFGLYDRPAEHCWHAGRVALIGDAAHPMLPFYAQGAAQALEDAATLGVLLAEAASEDVVGRLECYSDLRYARVRRVQEIAHAYAVTNNLPDGPEQKARDARLADPSNNAYVASGWLYAHDVTAAATEALQARSRR